MTEDTLMEEQLMEESNRAASHELLLKTVQQLKGEGWHCSAFALRGNASDVIVDKIRELKADLVIVGTKGKGWVESAFSGSVSKAFIQDLNVPVLVMKCEE